MSDALPEEPWLAWAAALAALFPAAVLVLGEVVARLRRDDHPLAGPLRLARNGAVPLLVGRLFLTRVLEWPADAISVRLVSTGFYLAALAAALGAANAVLFRRADRASWRARVPALFLDLSRFVLVLVGTSVILSTVWGQDLGGLLTALGVGSIVIGLALQDTLGNVFAGIAILFEKPYQEGDWVRFGDHLGRVREINWRSTRLDTHRGDTVVVPNGEIARGVLTNENSGTTPRYETFAIGFSYDHPPNDVKAVLLETVRATAGVMAEPPPQVFTTGYDDSSIGYEVRFAVDDLGSLPAVRDDFVTRVWYAARRHGLNIPFPIRTVFHYDGPGVAEEESRRERTLGREAVADVLPVEEGSALPERAVLKRFAAGERITRLGEATRQLHLIVSGRVALTGMGEPLRLGPGEIFGITSLLRKRPSEFDARASEDAVVVCLDEELVMDLVDSKPGFALQLERTIENRHGAASR